MKYVFVAVMLLLVAFSFSMLFRIRKTLSDEQDVTVSQSSLKKYANIMTFVLLLMIAMTVAYFFFVKPL